MIRKRCLYLDGVKEEQQLKWRALPGACVKLSGDGMVATQTEDEEVSLSLIFNL
jgi:hypothetical protein